MSRKPSKFSKNCRLLVKSVTNFEEKDENFKICVEFAESNLLYHTYADVNIFSVRKRIARFHEKFLIQSDLTKAKEFHLVTEKLLNLFDKQGGTKKELGYALLVLLLNLSESSDVSHKASKVQDSSSASEESWHFDWSSYLQEDFINHNSLSQSSSEVSLSEPGSVNESPSSDDDSLENLPVLRLPPRDDSGLGISPDSNSGASQHFHGALPISEGLFSLLPRQEKNYDTFYPYWLSRHQKMFGSSPYNLKSMNFTKMWTEHMMNQNLFSLIEKKVILHERNVVKEVLWMLMGVKDLFVAYWDGQKFYVNTQLHLSNLTSQTLVSVLSELCEYASRKATVQEFLSNILRDVSLHCITYQAYAWAVQEQLIIINAALHAVEKRLRKGYESITLLSLKNELKPIFSEIDLLYHIHLEISNDVCGESEPVVRACQLLHTLWKLLHHQSLLDHKSCSMKIVLKVFLKSCKPYFSFLEELIILGTFKDPYGEFIVKRGDLSPTDEAFWEKGFSFRPIPSDMADDFFLKPILSDVISAGKSLEIMNTINSLSKKQPFRLHAKKGDLYAKFIKVLKGSICKRLTPTNHALKEDKGDQVMVPQCTPKDPMLMQEVFVFNSMTAKFFQPEVNPVYRVVTQKVPDSFFSQYHIELFRTIEELEPDCLKPLSKNIHRTLETCMAFAYYPVCKRLIQMLKDDYQVLTHLNIMKKYFLMESGDLMFSFYSELFEKIFYKQQWLDVSFLYSALQNAIADDKENSSKLCVFLDAQNSEINVKQPLSHLNALQLSYEVEWPVSMMLGTDVQNKYCHIFSFLLQTKCAKYLLDSLYNIDLNKTPEKSQSRLVKLGLRSDFPREQKIHGMCIIRMRLLFFVNGLHNYIMTRILHSFDAEFLQVLENCRTVDDMIRTHSVYLKCLHERCLLDRRIAYLKEHIFQVLNLCYAFQQIWLTGVDKASLDDLRLIENQFSEYSNFLLSSFSAPSRRGTMEILVNTTLSNTHSFHVFSVKH